MSPEDFKELIDRYVTGDLSQEDRAVFASLLKKPEYLALLEASLEASFMEDQYEGAEPAQRKEHINKIILDRIAADNNLASEQPRIHFFKRPFLRIAIAAMIILAIGSALFNWFKPAPGKQLMTKQVKPPADISPGRNGAILTLNDGSKIVLDSLVKETMVKQGNTSVVLSTSQLAYSAAPNLPDAAMSYNTLTVPRGRQFQVVLPDGSKVWLNAASSLRYPTVFSGSERVVEMSGEAYFEITHDANKPFIVRKGDTDIRVLGTHFNVNAYDDEDSKDITLLQGSVSVKNKDGNVTIKPGQQAQVTDRITVDDDVDVDEVVAWKDGKFQFGETADIKTVMHQISNWYDVDVTYKGKVTKHIGGTISRNVSLSQLLKVLETTGVVRFKVEGRGVEVSPQ